jgi:hypothetical protein
MLVLHLQLRSSPIGLVRIATEFVELWNWSLTGALNLRFEFIRIWRDSNGLQNVRWDSNLAVGLIMHYANIVRAKSPTGSVHDQLDFNKSDGSPIGLVKKSKILSDS